MLSTSTIAILTQLLDQTQISVSHPEFESVVADFALAKRELAALSQ